MDIGVNISFISKVFIIRIIPNAVIKKKTLSLIKISDKGFKSVSKEIIIVYIKH